MTAAVLDRPAIPTDQAGMQDAVAATQQGDDRAFDTIYRRYQPTVLGFIIRRVQNLQTAEDLTADVFIRAYRNIGSFTWQGRDLGAWLITIARNRVIDHFRSVQVKSEFAMDIFETDLTGSRHCSIADRPQAADQVALGRADSSHLDEILADAISTLTPPQQVVIRLRFLEQLTVAETAVRLGLNPGAVKGLTCRAMAVLRQHSGLSALWGAES